MENYVVEDAQNKTTTTNKPYIKATLRDPSGNITEGVSIWSDFPGFHAIRAGHTVMGELTTNGKFKNLKPTGGGGRSYTPTPGAGGTTGGGARPAYGAKAAQERKGVMIEEAQERKELSMRLSGAMRDATLVTLASLKDQPFPDDDDFKKVWEMWRDYFMGEYKDKKESEDVPF